MRREASFQFGHIEPIDRDDPAVATRGLLVASAMREMVEETGLEPGADAMTLAGYINSDSEDVSSVHFGVVFRVDLDALAGADAHLLDLVSAQSEPHQARWIPAAELAGLLGEGAGPDGGSFEDWSRIAIAGTL